MERGKGKGSRIMAYLRKKLIVYLFENGKKYNLFQFFWFAQKLPMVVLIGTEILLVSSATIVFLTIFKGILVRLTYLGSLGWSIYNLDSNTKFCSVGGS